MARVSGREQQEGERADQIDCQREGYDSGTVPGQGINNRKPGIAAWYGKYIMDRAGQEFRGLWGIQPGDQVIFVTARYRCIAITTGYSDRGIRAKDGELPDEDLYLCTCAPGGEEFEIYIVVLEKEQ